MVGAGLTTLAPPAWLPFAASALTRHVVYKRYPHALLAYPVVAPVLFAAELAPDSTAACTWLPRVRWLTLRLSMPAPSAWTPFAGALVAWMPSCAEGLVQLKMADGRRAASSYRVRQ